MAQGLDMLDKIMKLTDNSSIQKVTNTWKYLVRITSINMRR